jgi:hypothetical protein
LSNNGGAGMSNEYTPDKWELIEIVSEEGETLYKILSSWYGGYGGSDSWRFSSGITKVVEHNKHYEVHNDSGSVYICYKGSKGMSAYTGIVFTNLKKQLEAKKLGTLKIVNRIKLNQFKQGEANE